MPEDARLLKEHLEQYREKLSRLGLRDYQVCHMSLHSAPYILQLYSLHQLVYCFVCKLLDCIVLNSSALSDCNALLPIQHRSVDLKARTVVLGPLTMIRAALEQ
jgi:hypothetical protein